MGKGMLLYEEDPLGGEGAGTTTEDHGADPLGGEGGGGGGGEGTDPLGGEGGAEGEGAGGTEADPPRATAPDTQAALAAAVAKLADKLDAKPGQAAMTPEQQEAAWQELEAKSGMSRQQLQWQDQQTRRAVMAATLESNKEVGKTRAEKIVDDPELLAEVEKQMATLPPEIQGNPKAWEDASYLVLGKASRTVKKTNNSGQGNNGGAGGQSGTRRIIGGTGTTTQTRGAAGGKPPVKKEYPAFEQHVIDRQFGGNAAEYEKYKGKSSIENDVRIKAPANAGAADAELERLTRDNS